MEKKTGGKKLMPWGGRKPIHVQLVICKVCEKQFSFDGYHAAPKKYCSYQCAVIAKAKQVKQNKKI